VAGDFVLVILDVELTAAERTLIDDDRPEAVHQIRRTFQMAMRDRFVGVVEEATDAWSSPT
jgi:hypothetical protein